MNYPNMLQALSHDITSHVAMILVTLLRYIMKFLPPAALLVIIFHLPSSLTMKYEKSLLGPATTEDTEQLYGSLSSC